MTVYLLDVNVLLALSDPMHLHHEAAHVWFVEKGKAAWATCPITENGGSVSNMLLDELDD